VFANQRKALELSILKNKRFEEQANQLTAKNRDLAIVNQTQNS
jgi:hypothetical protein